VLIKTLNMVNPDVTVDSTGSIVISSEEGETECNEQKLLCEMNIVDGIILKCDDFFQSYELSIIISHFDAERDDVLFEVIADKSQLQPKLEDKSGDAKEEPSSRKRVANGNDSTDDGPSTSKRSRPAEVEDDDDDDCLVVEEEDDVEEIVSSTTDKLTVKGSPPKTAAKRKPRIGSSKMENEDITDILDSSEEDDVGPTKCKRTKLSEPDSADCEVISID